MSIPYESQFVVGACNNMFLLIALLSLDLAGTLELVFFSD